MQLGMVAGEASGDLLAAQLLPGLRQRWPALQAAGIGGPRMTEQGFEAWWPLDKLAVHGYVDALRNYRVLSGIRKALARRLVNERPAAFIGIDTPDFNLGLERQLKVAGIKTIHYVCPTIWAWRGGRVKTIGASCDLVLCLFPFEPALLHAHGVAAVFVGHPAADSIPLQPPRAAGRASLGLNDSDTVVAVLPGSRRSEIELIGPSFLQAAARLHRVRPGLRFVLPAAPGLRGQIEPLVAQHAPGVPLQLIEGQSHAALAACDVTLIASGTATLEAALFRRPMVIGYRMHALSWKIMRRMSYQPWAGLPNILLKESVVPELLQDDCQPQALATAVLAWLDDPAACDRVSRRFEALHHLLKRDTARCATDAIAQVLQL